MAINALRGGTSLPAFLLAPAIVAALLLCNAIAGQHSLLDNPRKSN